MSNLPSPPELLSALVVDDEELACQGLCRKLKALGGFASIDSLTDPALAVMRLRDAPPDVLFLDVNMPGLSGFDLLAHFPEATRPFATVFCTAHDAHATRAFEAAALDFLVKPVDPARLAATVARIRRVAVRPSGQDDLGRARAQGIASWLERIVVRLRGSARIVELADVTSVASEAHHAVAYTRADEHVLECSLSTLEAQLDPARFVRCHRAHLVHLSHVERVEADHVLVSGGREVPLSRRNRTAFLTMLEKHAGGRGRE